VLVAFALQGQISQPAVGVDDAARFYRVLQKGHQACGRGVYNLAHPNPTDPGPIFLSGNDNQGFIQIEPAGQALLQTADVAFIYLHSAREQITPRSYHGAAQFMQQCPRCLIPFQSQHSLQSQRASPVLLSGHPPHGAKPHRQRSPRILEDRSGCDRSLVPTPGTLPQTSHRPRFLRSAVGTAETRRPTESCQIRPTRVLGSEVRLKLRQITRILFHHSHTTYWAYLSQADTHLEGLVGRNGSGANGAGPGRVISAAARRRMAPAQKLRWA